MKDRTKTKLKIFSSLLGMLFTAVLISFVIVYAWFASNNATSANSIKAEVSNPYQMFFESVDATKYDLDGSSIVNHYTIEGTSLKLSSSKSYDSNNVENTSYEAGESTSFLFDEILPGEYITVTVNYYLAEELAGSKYHIALHDFSNSGTFSLTVDSGDNAGTYDYYVVGAFKYKAVEAKFFSDEAMTNEIEDKKITYSDDYRFIDNYIAFQSETLPESVDFDSLTWDASYKRASFTFTLEEDISGFYKLIDESGEYYSNLLSEKSLIISSLRIVIDEFGE